MSAKKNIPGSNKHMAKKNRSVVQRTKQSSTISQMFLLARESSQRTSNHLHQHTGGVNTAIQWRRSPTADCISLKKCWKRPALPQKVLVYNWADAKQKIIHKNCEVEEFSILHHEIAEWLCSVLKRHLNFTL